MFREKRESKRAAASRLNEKATSPFSPSLRLWKPWKTEKRFTHRSHSLRSPSFSSLTFSPYSEKCPFSIPKKYSCRDEQRAACQYGKEKQTAYRRFYPRKKSRNATAKPSIAPFDMMLGFLLSSIPRLRENRGYFGA